MPRMDYVRRTGIVPSRNEQFDRIAGAWELEELRQALRRELRTHRGQQALARLIGVGRSVLRKFLEMRSVPEPRNLALIRDWSADRPAVVTPLGPVCLSVLVEDLPPAARYHARREIAAAIIRLYRQSGEEVPEWLTHEVTDRRGRT